MVLSCCVCWWKFTDFMVRAEQPHYRTITPVPNRSWIWFSVVDNGRAAEAVTMKNPILAKIHETQSTEIAMRFPVLQTTQDQSALLLWKYIEQRPQKFFSELARQLYLRELERLDKESSTALRQLIFDEIKNINNAFRHVDEINGYSWHDDPLQSEDDYRKLMLIDQNLNPAYLRLTEAVLKPLLMIPAYFSRIGRGKGTAKLELYDIAIELGGTDLEKVLQPYEPLVRNGIAHGGVTYGANRVLYKDKKGNSKELQDNEVIDLFDELLDVCNGLIVGSVLSMEKTWLFIESNGTKLINTLMSSKTLASFMCLALGCRDWQGSLVLFG